MQDMVRTRIAPSPTGDDLHIGNAYTALINYIFAKQQNGKFIVRIEDTDQTRNIKGAQNKILDTINWLGLTPDESPKIPGNFGPYIQSKRLALYKKYADQLVSKGFAYYCFCDSKRLNEMRLQQQKLHKAPMYDGLCKKITQNEALNKINNRSNFVIRFNVPDTDETIVNDIIRGKVLFKNNLIDDFIIMKTDGFPTYHLAVVVDDHLMEISHVIRAEEWLSSTPKHILLYKALNWRNIPKFVHTPILRNPDKSKLSKRKNPVWLSWYRETGFLPQAICNYLLTLGWSHPQDKSVFSLDEAIEKFSFGRVVKSGPVFDLKKLTWINGEYIRMMSVDSLAKSIYTFLNNKVDRKLILRVVPLLQDRIKTLNEVPLMIDFFQDTPAVNKQLLVLKNKSFDQVKKILASAIKMFSSLDTWQTQVLHDTCKELADDEKWEAKELFQIIRIAISGKTITPPLFESLEILGKTVVVKRLQAVLTA